MKKILKNKKVLLLIFIIINLCIRAIFLNCETGDYKIFLNPWINTIRDLGYFRSLKYTIGNYNVPYVFILTIISLFKIKPLYLIKLVSVIFDFICAIYAYKITKKITKNDTKSNIAFICTIFLPTVLINSSLWGQCDSIFAAFTLISLYYLINKKYTLSFIFLGVSFAFKLQFIFILPLYVYMFFREKEIHLYHFLLIPLVNIILCLPAIIAGRNILDILLIYLKQSVQYNLLSMNFPNLYLFFNNPLIGKIGILLTGLIFAIMLIYIIFKKVKFNYEKILLVGIWSIVIATFFLPHMHERYMFVADILSFIYVLNYEKKVYLVFSINLVSVIAYFYSLMALNINLSIVVIVYFIIVIIFTIQLLKELGGKNEIFKKRKS